MSTTAYSSRTTVQSPGSTATGFADARALSAASRPIAAGSIEATSTPACSA